MNYITVGSRQNTFNIGYSYTDDGNIEARNTIKDVSAFHQKNVDTFFGNIGQFGTMSEHLASNKQSFYDLSSKMLVHNIYPLSKTRLQTTAKKHSSDGIYHGTQEIIVPTISSDVISFCQFQNYAYGLTRSTTATPTTIFVKYDELASKQDMSYCNVLSNESMMTYLYHTPNDLVQDSALSTYKLMIDSYPNLSSSLISSIFNPKRNLLNVEHNYLLELPESTIYNDYDMGYIQCDMNVMKNHLNYLYSMEVHKDHGTQLSNCRDYCNINVCGNQIYATYRTNVHYTSQSNTVTYSDTIQDRADSTLDEVEDIPMRKVSSDYSYQHVEIIEGINRYDGSIDAGHKPSLFSLKLVDTGLNESTIPENVKSNLRQNIKNNLRVILDTIIPANTQLFDIYFEGK